jgi:hypothetical protein
MLQEICRPAKPEPGARRGSTAHSLFLRWTLPPVAIPHNRLLLRAPALHPQFNIGNWAFFKPGLPAALGETDLSEMIYMGYGLMFAVITAAIISGVAVQRMRVSERGRVRRRGMRGPPPGISSWCVERAFRVAE